MTNNNEKLYRAVCQIFAEKGDYSTVMMLQNELAAQQQEEKQLIDKITKEVLSRIKVNVDVTKAIQELDKLNKAIKNIGK